MAPPQSGIFVPAGTSPREASMPPADWSPLTASARPNAWSSSSTASTRPATSGPNWPRRLVRAGYKVARFEYPNDQRIRTSAALLLDHLRAAHGQGLDEIAIVAHSMGGLVFFDAMTREDGYAGDVVTPEGLPRITRLVAVGTPWNGSSWAQLQAVGEMHEQVTRVLGDASGDIRPMLHYRRDGSGQAGDDLLPTSAFITDIRARAWPEHLPLTIIAGRITNPDPATYESLAESTILRELLGPDDLEAFIADLRAASEDLGDGVVSLDSAFARETDDKHVFAVNHRALLHDSPIDFLTGRAEAGPPAIPIILERLELDAARRTPSDPPQQDD
ncbi:MAG: hypothetical protein HND58_01195 [Planctomycetota bacterium]|nr:MAG: hypothetical protein HND58_01195 [Planctomycetota bacterium]